jgi:hypothetical protein
VAVEEEESGAAVGVGKELEDGRPAEARGELLRYGAGGDDGEEARDSSDEVAELGVLVRPEAEQRRGGVEEAADGEGGARGGGAPREQVRLRGQQAAALRQPRLVGRERAAEAAGRGGQREEVAGSEVRRDERQHVLREGEDEVGAVPGDGEHRGDLGWVGGWGAALFPPSDFFFLLAHHDNNSSSASSSWSGRFINKKILIRTASVSCPLLSDRTHTHH